jgi:hypothetical protein
MLKVDAAENCCSHTLDEMAWVLKQADATAECRDSNHIRYEKALKTEI